MTNVQRPAVRRMTVVEGHYSAKPKPTPAPAKPAAPGQAFLDAFGPQGGVWFAECKTFAEAQALQLAELKSTIEGQEKERARLYRALGIPDPQAAKTVKSLEGKLNSNGLARFAAGIQFKKSK
jgi:hypothetical protein